MISPYFKVFYSVPPKLEMTDGERTKDWNDLYKITKSNTEVRQFFEDGIKRLTKVELVQILRRLAA